MAGERVRQAGRKSIGGVPPQILGMVASVHVLFKVELLDGNGFFAVGQTHEHVRHAEADIPRVVALAKHVPLKVRLVIEDLLQIAWTRQFRIAFEIEQRRVGSGDEGRVRGSRNSGHFLKQ